MADAPLVRAVSCHAWNKDLTSLALSPNNDEIHIYETPGRDSSKWVLKQILAEHGGHVAAIDWSHVTNQIATCGHDRNAYVWTRTAVTGEGGTETGEVEWRPGLVILRINRAATNIKWSPSGKKFAVTSGAKCIPICYYDKTPNWWISKMVKKHKSTVLTVDWSPDDKLIITGGTDFKARICSAYIEGVDEPFGETDTWKTMFEEKLLLETGEPLFEFDQTKAWVNSVSWSKSGTRLAFAGHGSTTHFVQLTAGSAPVVQTISEKHLPYLDIKFINDDTLVAAGWDLNVAVYVCKGGHWEFKEWLDKAEKKEKKAAGGAFSSSRTLFAGSADRGGDFGATEETELPTKHQNTISVIQQVGTDEIATSGLDGRVLFWKVK